MPIYEEIPLDNSVKLPGQASDDLLLLIDAVVIGQPIRLLTITGKTVALKLGNDTEVILSDVGKLEVVPVIQAALR